MTAADVRHYAYSPRLHRRVLTALVTGHLSANGNQHHVAQHRGNPDTTIVAGERYVVVRPTRRSTGSHYPDLLVVFDMDPAAYVASNSYVISEQETCQISSCR